MENYLVLKEGDLMKRKSLENLENTLFLLPATLISVLFLIVPLLVCFYYSVTNYDGFTSKYHFVALSNFKNIITDDTFISSLKTTLIMTIFSVIFVNVVGILLATWMDNKNRAYKFSKSLIFIPCILSSVVVSFMWSYMTQMNGGIINTIMGFFHAPPIDFFTSQFSITMMVSFIINWAALGFYITIYDATLKTIPQEIYEASKVDGASSFKKFFYITLPLLTPGIRICTIFSIIGGLKQYDFVKIITPKQIYTMTVYAVEKAFDFNMFGYASAIVLVLFIFIILISILQLFLMKKFEVHY